MSPYESFSLKSLSRILYKTPSPFPNTANPPWNSPIYAYKAGTINSFLRSITPHLPFCITLKKPSSELNAMSYSDGTQNSAPLKYIMTSPL